MDLVNIVSKSFVKKDVKMEDPAVKAAILTASSEMANCSGIVTSDEAIQVLSPLFNGDDEMVKSLIGMGPQYVNSNIGYSVDFRDYGIAQANYNANKEQYDQIYLEIQKQLENTNNMSK